MVACRARALWPLATDGGSNFQITAYFENPVARILFVFSKTTQKPQASLTRTAAATRA